MVLTAVESASTLPTNRVVFAQAKTVHVMEVEEFFEQMRTATEIGNNTTATLAEYAASIGDRWTCPTHGGVFLRARYIWSATSEPDWPLGTFPAAALLDRAKKGEY